MSDALEVASASLTTELGPVWILSTRAGLRVVEVPADLHHLARERPPRKRVHRKAGRLAFFDASDISFGYVRVNLHFRQVVGDDK